MVVICKNCQGQIEAPQAALNKKVRCPICGNVFVASLPKAEFLENERVESTVSGQLPIALSPEPTAAPPTQVEEADPLAQLVAAGLKPGGRRRIAIAGRKKTHDARKALESFAAAPPSQVHWPGDEDEPTASAKGEAAPKKHPPKTYTRRRRISKDVWYVVAGDYEYGPYAPEAILSAVRSGNISSGVELRHVLTDSVISAGQILQSFPQEQHPGEKAAPKKARNGKANKGAAPGAAGTKPADGDALTSALESMAGQSTKSKQPGKNQSPGR